MPERTIASDEARRAWGQLLDAVHDETVVITRHGRPVADLVPHGRLQRCERQVRELEAAVAATPGGAAFLAEWKERDDGA